MARCREHLASYKRPKQYELVDELPRSPYGKVLKRQLRDRLSQSAASSLKA
jgi:long-chain acyl-CoA synthetase